MSSLSTSAIVSGTDPFTSKDQCSHRSYWGLHLEICARNPRSSSPRGKRSVVSRRDL